MECLLRGMNFASEYISGERSLFKNDNGQICNPVREGTPRQAYGIQYVDKSMARHQVRN
jgi:hypothetical protein